MLNLRSADFLCGSVLCGGLAYLPTINKYLVGTETLQKIRNDSPTQCKSTTKSAFKREIQHTAWYLLTDALQALLTI